MEPSRIRPLGSAGFSLVEMIVVLSIIAVVTTIALLAQSTFNRSLFLTDTAYSVALSLREMQTLGLSSRKTVAGIQNAGYGMYVAAATRDQYVLFADTARTTTPNANCLIGPTSPATPETKPGDCVYAAGSDEALPGSPFTFSRGFTISNACATVPSGRYCYVGTTPALTALSISFLRSSTDTMGEALISGTWRPITKAEIYISSSDLLGTRGICVSQVGQVSVTSLAQCP